MSALTVCEQDIVQLALEHTTACDEKRFIDAGLSLAKLRERCRDYWKEVADMVAREVRP